MIKYRTIDQFNEIADSVYYGNFSIASKQALEYGFYAVDFKRMLNENKERYSHIDIFDLYFVIELMTELRTKEVN
jgi:hypothetical protein